MHAPLDVRIFYKHARTLAAAGHEVTLLAPHIYAPRSNEEVVEKVRIKTVPTPASRRERMSRTMWQLYQLAIAEDADVYHFHDPELIPLGLLLKARGKKVIYDVHEDLPSQILDKEWVPPGLRALTSKAQRPSLWTKHTSFIFAGRFTCIQVGKIRRNVLASVGTSSCWSEHISCLGRSVLTG